MAVITGHQGAATMTDGTAFSDLIINVTEWSMAVENQMFNGNVFGDSANGQKHVRGKYTARGSIGGYLNAEAAAAESTFETKLSELAPGSASAALTLTQNTGKSWVFPAHLFNWKPDVHRTNGLMTYMCDFESDGAITTVPS